MYKNERIKYIDSTLFVTQQHNYIGIIGIIYIYINGKAEL